MHRRRRGAQVRWRQRQFNVSIYVCVKWPPWPLCSLALFSLPLPLHAAEACLRWTKQEKGYRLMEASDCHLGKNARHRRLCDQPEGQEGFSNYLYDLLVLIRGNLEIYVLKIFVRRTCAHFPDFNFYTRTRVPKTELGTLRSPRAPVSSSLPQFVFRMFFEKRLAATPNGQSCCVAVPFNGKTPSDLKDAVP